MQVALGGSEVTPQAGDMRRCCSHGMLGPADQ